MALIKFEIPPRSRRCEFGKEDFSQGMEYYSVLEDTENEGFHRKDYCETCWEKLLLDPETASFGKVHWKSRVPVKKQDSYSSLQRDEKAMELLKEILQDGRKEDAPQAFVLTLLLVRNKMLQFKQEILDDDGQVVLLYEVAATEEMIAVQKIDLSLIQIEKIQKILAEKLMRSEE